MPNADDGDCTTDILCSVCRAVLTEGKDAHTDENRDGKCDSCQYDIPDDGIGTGAIVGIALGSATAVGIGGFALLWFVIKKKSFSDLMGIFKK